MGRSICEIYRLSQEDRRKEYEAVDIGDVDIDGDIYRNYGQFSFMWEKSYVKPPSRGAGLAINNLNAHATGIVGHLSLDYSIMSIDDYRSLINKDLEKNEFPVTFYDTIKKKRITLNMYLATPEKAKYRTIANRIRKSDGSFEEWVDLVGVEEYTVELIGTNTDVNKVSVIYHLNPPSELGITDQTEGEDDVAKGTEIIMGGASTFPDYPMDGYEFAGWSIYTEKQDKGNYIDGNAYTINDDLVLYAIWQPTNERVLTYDYGLSQPMYNDKAQPVLTKTVQKGKSIGYLPTFDVAPKVEYNGKSYEPYYNGGWYKTPIKAPNSVKIANNTTYWQDTNGMIHLLYDTKTYSLSFTVNMNSISFPTQNIPYGASINLPTLVVSGYDFLGWYVEGTNTKFTETTMPPIDISLVAKWKKV